MPVPTIFLTDNDNKIMEMKDQPYDSEDLLQKLLAQYPSVLAGDQMNSNAPVKWLLVAREAGIPGEEGGGERWSLDHVFIDQNGIPTLVEVKRSSDTLHFPRPRRWARSTYRSLTMLSSICSCHESARPAL